MCLTVLANSMPDASSYSHTASCSRAVSVLGKKPMPFAVLWRISVRFAVLWRISVRFAVLWRISVRFCGFRTPLTLPSIQ